MCRYIEPLSGQDMNRGPLGPLFVSSCRSGGGNCASGFTLVELLAVIVLLGVLAAISAPKFASNSTFDERFFYDDAISAIRFARKLAVAKGCYIQFTLNSTQFVLNYDTQCGVGSPNLSGVLYRPGGDEVYSNSDVPSGSSTWSVVFSAAGQAGRISSGNFVMLSSTETVNIGSWSLQVDGPTGFVR